MPKKAAEIVENASDSENEIATAEKDILDGLNKQRLQARAWAWAWAWTHRGHGVDLKRIEKEKKVEEEKKITITARQRWSSNQV